MARRPRPALASLASALLSTFALAFSPRAAAAQPACTTGSFLDYVNLGAGGCTIGSVLFSGASNPVGAPPSYSERATVTPFSTALGDGRTLAGFDITWNPALTVPDPARPNANTAGWSATFDVSTSVGGLVGAHVGELFYSLVPGTSPFPNGIFVDAQWTAYELGDRTLPSQLGMARRKIAVSCASPAACFETGTVSYAPQQAISTSFFGNATGTLLAQYGASATLSGARFGVIVDPTATVVPEPATLALLATGLGGVGLVARRRRAR